MGHWARIDENNIVQEVIVIKEAELDTGNWGDKSQWIKTSYNTREGKHYLPQEYQDYTQENPDQSKALRYRYAGIGMYYDATNDVFYWPQPFPSWTLDTTTWNWKAPIDPPPITKEQEEAKGIGYVTDVAGVQLVENTFFVWDEDLYQSDTGNPKTKGWKFVSS